MTIKQMRAITNKNFSPRHVSFSIPVIVLIYIFYSIIMYNIDWKVEQFPKSYT